MIRVISSTLTYVAPLLESVVTLTAGSADGAAVATIIGVLQSDLGFVAVAIEDIVDATSISSALSAIESNLSNLLTLAKVTDPTTQTAITSTVDMVVNVIKAVISSFELNTATAS